MSHLRNIRDDLMEKRLWPVAVVLVLGLIATPVLALQASRNAAEAPPSSSTPVAPVQSAPTALEPKVLSEKKLADPRGAYHDPFRNATDGVPAADKASTAGVATTVVPNATPKHSGTLCATCRGDSVATSSGTSSGSATTVASGPDSSSSGGTKTVSSGSGATSSQPSTPAKSPTRQVTTPPVTSGYAAGYRVDVDWGPVADPRSVDNLTRLQLLKAAGTPQVVFLGVRDDGKHALFMIAGQHVSASGDGRCLPDADHCHLVQIASGGSQLIDIPTSIGMAQYQLTVNGLAERYNPSFRRAIRIRRHKDKAGAAFVKQRINAGFNFARRFVYTVRRGVITYHPN